MNLRKKIQILLAFLVGMPLLLLLFESYQAGRHSLMTEMKQEALQIAQFETAESEICHLGVLSTAGIVAAFPLIITIGILGYTRSIRTTG